LLHFPFAVEVAVVLPRMVAFSTIVEWPGRIVAEERRTPAMNLLEIDQKLEHTMLVTVGEALGHNAEGVVIRGIFLNMVVSFHN
jgi:hypothetical protein